MKSTFLWDVTVQTWNSFVRSRCLHIQGNSSSFTVLIYSPKNFGFKITVVVRRPSILVNHQNLNCYPCDLKHVHDGRTRDTYIIIIIIIFSGTSAQRGKWPPRSRGFVITRNDAPQSVGLLWTSDQLDAETSNLTHNTHIIDKHPRSGAIRTHDRSRPAPVDLRLRPRGHWGRLTLTLLKII
jgi:hypothetical protein